MEDEKKVTDMQFRMLISVARLAKISPKELAKEMTINKESEAYLKYLKELTIESVKIVVEK